MGMKERVSQRERESRTIQGSGRNQKAFVDNRNNIHSKDVIQKAHDPRWCTITICGRNAAGKEISITYRRIVRQHQDVQNLINAARVAFEAAGHTYTKSENLNDGAGDDPHGTDI